jgi:hypothetical protein
MDKHHNSPPLADRLALDHSDLMARAKEAAELVPAEIRAIESDEEAAAFTDTAADIKAVLREADAAFKAEKAPWLEGGKTVDVFFNGVRSPMQASATRAVEAVNAFQRLQLAAKRKSDAEAAEKARKEAEAFDEAAPIAAPVVVKEAARVVSFTGNKASASIKWEHRIIDATKIPRQYLMPNEAAIKAAIAGGIRAIDGVEIFESVRTAIRR